MNKAITDGLQLMPPAFAEGLGVWSSGDGTPGSDTYDGAAGVSVFIAADKNRSMTIIREDETCVCGVDGGCDEDYDLQK